MALADAVVAVRGCANADVDPEIARVLVGIRAREKDRLAAVEALAKADGAVWAVLSEYSGAVERSRSDGVRVWAESERPAKASKGSKADKSGRTGAGRVVGYTAVVWYEITVGDFAVLDEMSSALADQPGVELAGPQWALRADSGVYRVLRAAAVRDARARAEDYAEAAGGTLTGLIELSEDRSGPICDDEVAFPTEVQAGDETRASWVIQPARQSVSLVVDTRFSISQPYFP